MTDTLYIILIFNLLKRLYQFFESEWNECVKSPLFRNGFTIHMSNQPQNNKQEN